MPKTFAKYSLALCLLIVLFVFTVTGCTKAVTVTVEEETPLVRAQPVKMEGFVQSAGYSGEVRGRYESKLSFQVSGKIIKRNVELGSLVKPGDVLLEIDPKDIQETLNVSSAQVSSAQWQLSLAKNNLDRYKRLYEANAVSHAEYEQYQNAYNLAEEAVNQALAQHNKNVNQLEYAQLCADLPGVISSINAEVGQVVSAGQTIITVVQDSDREVEISIPENRINELKNARQIDVTFWALPDVVVKGKVREISPVADEKSRTYDVRISLPDTPRGIELGMTADVRVTNSSGEITVFIPLSAIYQTGEQPAVWIIENEIVTLKPVRIGTFGDGEVQIREGLQDGDIIVTAGVNKLREGQRVRIAGDNQ